MKTHLLTRPDSEPVDADEPASTSGLVMTRDDSRAQLEVVGRLDELTRRHLDDWLDWLAGEQTSEVTVTLASADQLDSRLLDILRIAQSRLTTRGADLVVTFG